MTATFVLVKRFIVISLVFVFLLQLGANISVKVWYELNVEYITELFCENKDKPELQCNGKCHLAKQMKKSSEDTHPAAVEITELIWLTYLERDHTPIIRVPELRKEVAYSHNEDVTYEEHLNSVFHPPQNSFWTSS